MVRFEGTTEKKKTQVPRYLESGMITIAAAHHSMPRVLASLVEFSLRSSRLEALPRDELFLQTLSRVPWPIWFSQASFSQSAVSRKVTRFFSGVRVPARTPERNLGEQDSGSGGSTTGGVRWCHGGVFVSCRNVFIRPSRVTSWTC